MPHNASPEPTGCRAGYVLAKPICKLQADEPEFTPIILNLAALATYLIIRQREARSWKTY